MIRETFEIINVLNMLVDFLERTLIMTSLVFTLFYTFRIFVYLFVIIVRDIKLRRAVEDLREFGQKLRRQRVFSNSIHAILIVCEMLIIILHTQFFSSRLSPKLLLSSWLSS